MPYYLDYVFCMLISNFTLHGNANIQECHALHERNQ